MNILALDTSGPVASVALMRDGAIAHEIVMNHGLTHSQTALQMLDDVMTAASLMPHDIDLFAAVTGPGSFTGVRIGVCAVRALAHATGKPVLGVNALQALAANAYGFEGLLCPILDARRGQVYCAAFEWRGGALPGRTMPDRALPIHEFVGGLPGDRRLLFLGDGLSAHEATLRDALGTRAVIAPPHLAYLRAAAACCIASELRCEADAPELLLPTYLRAPQAERERAKKLAGEDGAHA